MNKKSKFIKLLIAFTLVVFFAYFLIMFLQWQFTLFHEAGHMQACKAVNIPCELDGKSFIQYLTFVNYNILNGINNAVDMQVIPQNITEFCNLPEAHQQFIRVAGFRRDIVLAFVILSLLVMELILFYWFILHRHLNKKRTKYLVIIVWIAILIVTTALLYLKLFQLHNYFSQNIGDMFYFPCNEFSK